MPGGSDFHAGRKVGKYEILTLLSMGGMAELFLAFTAGPGGFKKFVALKQILPDVKKDEAFVKMFLDEARITAAFSHANIGQVFDLGEDDGELYLAMEYISGQNLEQVFRACQKEKRQLPMALAVMVARDVCLGLHYAHHFVDPSGKPAPAIHRDVSPKNVMVTFDGNVKVIDFGIAKAKGRLGRTNAGMIKGTTAYMSPEQIRNEELDGRSDLFAAGIMLHEWLTGQRLFEGLNDATIMMRIVDGDIPSPRQMNADVPQALSDAVMKALTVDRGARYATGKEMARALEAAAGEVADEDDAAAFMQALFAERVKKTRALLEAAGKGDQGLSNVASALREEEAPPGGTPSRRASPGSGNRAAARGPSPKTPSPRTPPPRTPRPKMPEAPPRPPARRAAPVAEAPDSTEEVTPPPPSPKDRFKSEVAEAYSLYDVAAQDTQSLPGRRPQAASPQATGVRPALARESRKKGGFGRAVFWLLFFGLVGGGVWAANDDGPVGQKVRPYTDPLKQKAIAWFEAETAPEPPPPPDSAIVPTDPSGEPMDPRARALLAQREAEEEAARIKATQEAALAELEAKEAAAKAEAEAQAAAEEAAAAKKGGRPAKKATTTAATQPAAAATTATPAAATAAKTAKAQEPAPATTAAATKPASPAPVTEPAGLPNTTVTQDTGEVEVVDTRSAKRAAKSGVGFLSLYTVPSVWVYDGATSLGATPLLKVPLPAGIYRLRLKDSDGTYRTLSANIDPGKVSEMKIRVADLPVDQAQP